MAAPLSRRLAYTALTTVGVLGAIELGLQLWGARVRQQLVPPSQEVLDTEVLLAVGDSVTQGIPVEPHESWPGWFQRDPVIGAMGYEIVALGFGGKGWHHLDDLARDWLADHDEARDLTLTVLAGHNDCHYLAVPGGDAPAPLGEASGLRALLGRLASYRALVQVVARARGDHGGSDYGEVVPPGKLGDHGEHCVRQLASGVAGFQALAAHHDARLVVLTYPLPATSTSYLAQVNRVVNEQVLALAEARGVEALDLSRCTWELPDAEAFQHDRVHLTSAGYRQLATCIARGLGLPPGQGEPVPGGAPGGSAPPGG